MRISQFTLYTLWSLMVLTQGKELLTVSTVSKHTSVSPESEAIESKFCTILNHSLTEENWIMTDLIFAHVKKMVLYFLVGILNMIPNLWCTN